MVLSELRKGLYRTHQLVLFFDRFKIKNLEKNWRFVLFPDKDSNFLLLLYYTDFYGL